MQIVIAQLTSAFVSATYIVQPLYLLNPKFRACSHLMWLYSSVCVGRLKTDFLLTWHIFVSLHRNSSCGYSLEPHAFLMSSQLWFLWRIIEKLSSNYHQICTLNVPLQISICLVCFSEMNRVMRKPAFCICEGTNQVLGYRVTFSLHI